MGEAFAADEEVLLVLLVLCERHVFNAFAELGIRPLAAAFSRTDVEFIYPYSIHRSGFSFHRFVATFIRIALAIIHLLSCSLPITCGSVIVVMSIISH